MEALRLGEAQVTKADTGAEVWRETVALVRKSMKYGEKSMS